MDTSQLDSFGFATVEAQVAGRTDPGLRRTENQDNFLISDLSNSDYSLTLRPDAPAANGDTSLVVGPRGALLLVADGMGGAAAGRLASGLACTFILAELQDGWQEDRDMSPRQFVFRLTQAVEKANTRIHAHSLRHNETIGMGTTATVAGVFDGFVYIAQVGDSRAYLVRGGAATQVTRDQSLVQHMIDAGALNVADAEQNIHGNVILQALGVKPDVDVEVTYQELRADDFLLLCSDGLHRVIRDEEIADTAGRLGSPAAVCAELIALANERGAPDNVTAVAARFGGISLTAPRPGDMVSRTFFDRIKSTHA